MRRLFYWPLKFLWDVLTSFVGSFLAGLLWLCILFGGVLYAVNQLGGGQ